MAKVTKKTAEEVSAETAAEEAEEEEEVEAEKEPVITTGTSLSLWEGAGTFVALNPEMEPEERREAIRNIVTTAASVDDRLQLVKGEMFYEVIENSYWKEWTFVDDEGDERPFATFEEYCQVECGCSRRTAFYLRDIYRTYVVELELPEEMLSGLQWSKAKELVTIIDKENYEDLLNETADMTVTAVKDFVKATKAARMGKTTAETEVVRTVTKSFKLNEDQASALEQSLEIAGKLSGSEKAPAQLDFIISDFLASASSTADPVEALDAAIARLERNYGCKLTLEELDSPERFGGEEDEDDDE